MKASLLGGFRRAWKAFRGNDLGEVGQHGHGLLARLHPGARGEPPQRGTKEIIGSYSTHPWARANVGKIATTASSVPWQLFAVRRGGKFVKSVALQRAPRRERERLMIKAAAEGELKEITNHPLLDLIHKPTPFFFPGITARRLKFIYRLLVGESFEIIERSKTRGALGLGLPAELWPVPPHWVTSTPTPKHPFFSVSYGGWNDDIPMSDVYWHLRDPDPLNPYGRGVGIGRSLSDEMASDEAAARLQNYAFYNRGIPPVIVSMEGSDPEEVLMAEEHWGQKTRGIANVMKAFFTNSKVSVQQLAQSFKELELLELRKFERDALRMSLGIPPEIMGELENSNRATIDAADYHYNEHVVVPELEFEREYLQEFVAPEFDERLVVGYVNPVQEDKEYAKAILTVAPWAFSIDEIRARAGEEPRAEGDGTAHMVPFGQRPVHSFEEQEAPPAPPPLPGLPAPAPAAEDPENEDDDEQKGHLTGRYITSAGRWVTRTHPLNTLEHWGGLVEKLFAPGEGHFERAYRGFLKDMRREQLALVDGATAPDTVALVSLPKWQGEAVRRTRPVHEQIVLMAVDEVLEEVSDIGKAGIPVRKDDASEPLELPGPNEIEVLLDHLSELVRGTVQTRRDRLERILAEAVRNGDSIETVRERINEAFGAMTDAVPALARDQASAAVSGGRELGMDAAGVEDVEWLNAGDERVRDNHVVYGAAGPRPRGFNYATLVGEGHTITHPHDPDCSEISDVANCRCVLLPAASAKAAQPIAPAPSTSTAAAAPPAAEIRDGHVIVRLPAAAPAPPLPAISVYVPEQRGLELRLAALLAKLPQMFRDAVATLPAPPAPVVNVPKQEPPTIVLPQAAPRRFVRTVERGPDVTVGGQKVPGPVLRIVDEEEQP